MKKLLGGIAVCLLLTGCGNSGNERKNADDPNRTYKIGIVQHTTHPSLDSAVEGFKTSLEGSGINVEFVEKNAQGDAGTNDLITKQFVNEGVDMIYAVATPSATAAYNATMDKDIPVVFNAVTDPADETLGLVKSMDAPGGNVTGVSDAAPLEEQLQLIQTFLPDVKTIGMIYNIGEQNGKIQVEQVKKLAEEYHLEIKEKGISKPSEIATAAQQLADSVDCIYNITDNSIVAATASITDKANAKNIPVFAAEDGGMSAGLLASDSINYEKLGEQAGEMAYDILVNGKKPADMPVQTAKDTTLYINKKVAEKLNIQIPEELATRATYIE